MTSQLNVDTIVDKAGTGGTNIKVGNDATYVSEGGSANSNNVVQGLCKAWVSLNGTGTAAIRDSFNTSSITDNATGTYTQTFSNNMNNSGYTGATHVVVTTNGDCSATGEATQPITTQFRVGCRSLANVLVDPQNAMTQIVGDLA